MSGGLGEQLSGNNPIMFRIIEIGGLGTLKCVNYRITGDDTGRYAVLTAEHPITLSDYSIARPI